MPYPVLELINGAYYTSGVVSREFQTVSGTQANDGLFFLNDILADKTVENDMIPYFTKYNFNAIKGQEAYFIPNLIQLDTFTFFIDTVRYSMTDVQRRMFFGSSRANNIQSLPYNWHLERCVGGAKLYLYFLPDTNYPLEIWGQFRLSEVSLNQDLYSKHTSVNLGTPVLTGAGTLAPGQLVINNIDLDDSYATPQLLAAQITADVPNVSAIIIANELSLSSTNVSNPSDITIQTTGIGNVANTISFANFNTLEGPLSQTYFPLQLDRFYISYLKYSLAKRICLEFDYEVPALVEKQLLKYEGWISKKSQQLDLTSQKISTLQNSSSINYAQVNLGRGWTT